MSGQRWTLPQDGRERVARVVAAVRILGPDPMTDQELADAAGFGSRETLYRVARAQGSSRASLVGLDRALRLPPGTLEAIGRGQSVDDYEIDDDARKAIRRASVTPTATGSNQTGM